MDFIAIFSLWVKISKGAQACDVRDARDARDACDVLVLISAGWSELGCSQCHSCCTCTDSVLK